MRVLAVLLSALLAAAGPAGGAPQSRWPLDPQPRVERGFDPPAQPWLAGHRGADLAARPGQAVLAPLGGVVEFAGPVVDRGVVVIRAGQLRVSLEPVTASVRVGETVSAGDPVGVVGPGRSHCAPTTCLHWGLRVGRDYTDPLFLTGAYRAVLLP